MRLLDRIVLIIYSLVLSLISIVIIMMGFHILPEYYIKNFAYLFRTYRYIIGIIGIVFLILSIRVMLSGMRGESSGRSISRQTQLGEVRISVITLQNIAERAVKGIEGVKEVKSRALLNNDGAVMKINLVVATNIKLPELVVEVQKLVKNEVESVTGINVAEVKVYIDNVTVNENKGRIGVLIWTGCMRYLKSISAR